MIEIPDLALGGLSAGTLLAFALGGGLWRSRLLRARQDQEIAGLRSRLDGIGQELDGARRESATARGEADRAAGTLAAEIVHLAAQRIPAEVAHTAHPHVRVPGPLDADLAGSALGDGLDQVLTVVLAVMARERTRVDAAARAGMRGATRDIQAGLYRLQDQLRGLQERYDEPELAQTLYALDHENEQSLRRAQVTAVVCGAWVGLAREESHLVEAVTGGQSRLVGYHRVQVNNHLEAGTALVSHAVEPVAIITAELLDNALRHSAPDTQVIVNLERVHHGVTITVDDSGVGMASDERAWAQRTVAGKDAILLSDLGDPPRLGLAAIGQLTRRFDLSVDISSPSPYGGVRAVLLIKTHLLSHIDPAEQPPAVSTPRSTRPAPGAIAQQDRAAAHMYADLLADDPAAGRSGPAAATVHGTPAAGQQAAPEDDVLPQRRRVRPAPPAQHAAPKPPPPALTPEQAATALGALQSGTAAARSAADLEGTDQP